jgi:septal ring factor EnvC (AmiA/AmiB activator)
MKALRHWTWLCMLLAGAIPFAAAQQHRDPFTPAEIDQIRDTSWEPQMRLSLYVKFARARVAAIEQLRNDPKVKDKAQQTHDRLDDFQLIYDELNDNIDTYVDRKNDIRKPLKAIIDADTEFQAKLRALKDAADVSPKDAQQYEFVLSSALEMVDSSAEDHRQVMADQQEAAKHRKKSDSVQASGRPE